jgi:hypothetical protein
MIILPPATSSVDGDRVAFWKEFSALCRSRPCSRQFHKRSTCALRAQRERRLTRVAACLWFVHGLQRHDRSIYLACIGYTHNVEPVGVNANRTLFHVQKKGDNDNGDCRAHV